MLVQGKVAFITGGGSGLGEAAARVLAREGAKVAVVGRHQEELDQTVQRITTNGGEAIAVLGEIQNPKDMERAAKEVADAFGGQIDIVFANAGVNGVWAPIDELEPEEFKQTIDINVNGTFLTIKYAVPYMKNGGSIIITSSVNGTRIFSNTGATAYSASKAAQVAIGKMLALELAQQRIRVNIICPGAIESNIDDNTEKRDVEKVKIPVEYPEGNIPLTDGAPGKAEDVGELVLFLASDQSKHISGTEMWIDGAQSLLQG